MARTAHLVGVSASRIAAVAAVLLAVLAGSGCSTSDLGVRPASGSGFVEDALFADRDRALAGISAAEQPDVDDIETGAIEPAAIPRNATDSGALGRAGVFGSVPIPIGNLPVSARWTRVERQVQECARATLCEGADGLLRRISAEADGKPLAEKLRIINAMVNGAIHYRSDLSLYGKRDYWAGPRDSLSRASGDCEDFAILKMTALLRAGVPANRLSLVVLRDNRRGAFHAVIAVLAPSGRFILDNNITGVVMDSSLPWYQPLYSFSEARAWVHGTRAANGSAVAQHDDLSSIAPGENFGG